MPRPREFDEPLAIERALGVFWRRGFAEASMGELEEATGLGRSSLYNTFGSKAELFYAALDAYRDGPCQTLHAPLTRLEGAAAIDGYLDGLTRFVSSGDAGLGCLMVNTSLETAIVTGDPNVRRRVSSHFSGLRADITRAIRRGRRDGELGSSLTLGAAADMTLAVVRGVLVGAVYREDSAGLARALRGARTALEL